MQCRQADKCLYSCILYMNVGSEAPYTYFMTCSARYSHTRCVHITWNKEGNTNMEQK
jgi:hypothetical protein